MKFDLFKNNKKTEKDSPCFKRFQFPSINLDVEHIPVRNAKQNLKWYNEKRHIGKIKQLYNGKMVK